MNVGFLIPGGGRQDERGNLKWILGFLTTPGSNEGPTAALRHGLVPAGEETLLLAAREAQQTRSWFFKAYV